MRVTSSLNLVGNLEFHFMSRVLNFFKLSEKKIEDDADDYDNDQSYQFSHQLIFAFIILFVWSKKGMESPGVFIVVFCHFIKSVK